ncbi:MAG TPA: TetR/AcrR family transcriptional regulator [Hyphomicrobiaceae bacterium]|nr:TetR/AcrR family transcriptional regulator [Hyphomicrobiaceae bacterium]
MTEASKWQPARFLDEDEKVYDDIFARARDLVDDPLQVMLVALRFLADAMADLPNGHPGCLVAASCYYERLFDQDVQDINREGVLRWRKRFRAMFDEISKVYPPREAIDLDELADTVSTVLEGGIVMAKALDDPRILPQKILVLRSLLKLHFKVAE